MISAAPAIPPIVTVDWVVPRVDDFVVADVRWYLDGTDGRAAFEAAHVPRAVFVDLDRWLAAPASSAAGRHPLPDPEVFAEGMSRCGIGDDTTVVAYDDSGGVTASRLVWMLRSLGRAAALLDGGLDAWTGPLASGPSRPAAATFTPSPWADEAIATLDEVAVAPVVVDARAPERYRGETEPVDPRAGHVPGAISRPVAGNLDPDSGAFLPAAALAERFAGMEDAVVYCGSGVSACHDLLAMERAGVRGARLYVGSWSQWSSDPGRPAATGPEPG